MKWNFGKFGVWEVLEVWGSRITNDTSYNFKKFGASIDIDKRLFREDIEASIVHVEILCKH